MLSSVYREEKQSPELSELPEGLEPEIDPSNPVSPSSAPSTQRRSLPGSSNVSVSPSEEACAFVQKEKDKKSKVSQCVAEL